VSEIAIIAIVTGLSSAKEALVPTQIVSFRLLTTLQAFNNPGFGHAGLLHPFFLFLRK
jgi:hypothetical protein